MTYGPQPGWNPNQPPVGPQPGYPAQQAGFPTGQQPGMPPAGQPMPGQPQMGQPPAGQFGPQGPTPTGPRSPLPIIAGALSLLSFAYLAFCTVVLVLQLVYFGRPVSAADPRAYGHVVDLMRGTNLVVELSTRVEEMIIAAAVGLVAILFLVGALLLLARKPSGRVVTIVASVGTIAITFVQFVGARTSLDLNAFGYVVPATALVVLVLCVLPATGQAMRRKHPADAPLLPQPQFGQPYQQPGYPQPGYPQQQPPGGYQQPPGGTPS